LITTGSKYFFGLAGVAFIAAVVYGIITNGIDHGGVAHLLSGPGAVDALLGPITFGYKGGVGEHVGYAVLMGFAGSSLGLGVASSAFRDSDAEALAQLDGAATAVPVIPSVMLNAWPFIAGLAVTAIVVGLATSPILFMIGCASLAIAGVEWAIANWAEQRSADPVANRTLRNQLMLPVEIPFGGVFLVGAVVYCFSRVFLSVSKLGAVWVALALSALFLGVAVILNSRPQIRRSLVVGVLVLGAVVVLAVGIAGAVTGPRTFEHHEPQQGAMPAVLTQAVGQEG